LIQYYTLWTGADHLLSIEWKVFSEDYKRFYYGDIQALAARRTDLGKIVNFILGFLGGLFLVLTIRAQGAGTVVLGLFAGFFLVALLINWWRGPTCVCHLHTAVQKEKLPSLGRLKNHRKAMERLRPLIEGVQGRLETEVVSARVAGDNPVGPSEPRIDMSEPIQMTKSLMNNTR
jgi:hypothetical protein